MKRKEAVLDTSVLIDHFNADPLVDKRLVELDFLLIPIPVVAEMEYGYLRLENHDPKKKRFDAFLERDDVEIIVCDRNVAKHFAKIKRQLKDVGGMIPINDIWIAACCVVTNVPLATRDNHFQRVPDLKVEMW